MNNQRGEKYLYIRVSSTDQNIISQQQLAKKYNVYDDCIFIDKLSGKDMERPKLNELLKVARKHDSIIVLSLDRLSRNAQDTVDIVETLQKKEVKLIVDNMPILSELAEKSHDDLIFRFMYKVILEVLSMQSQQSREYIKQRQAQGIEANKDKFKGKQRMYTKESTGKRKLVYDRIVSDIQKGVSINQASINADVSRNVVRRIMKEDDIKRETVAH